MDDNKLENDVLKFDANDWFVEDDKKEKIQYEFPDSNYSANVDNSVNANVDVNADINNIDMNVNVIGTQSDSQIIDSGNNPVQPIPNVNYQSAPVNNSELDRLNKAIKNDKIAIIVFLVFTVLSIFITPLILIGVITFFAFIAALIVFVILKQKVKKLNNPNK